MTNTASFKGKTFNILEGSTHPAYSLNCFAQGEDESDFRERFWDVKPGDVVVDVGASYGAYTLAALAAGAAEVWAFEPEPSVCPDLERNLAANPEWEGKYSVFQMALSDAAGHIDMHEYAAHWPQQTLTGKYPAATLDSADMGSKRDRLDWLKIDVEGHELEVLRGAAETLRRFKPTIILEVHTFLDATLLDRCIALLKGYGYDGFEFVDRDPCVLVIGRKL